MSIATGSPTPNHYPVDAITATTYTIPVDMGWILANPSGAATWTLPSLDNVMPGSLFWIRNISSNAITLNAATGQTVGGGASTSIPAQTTIQLLPSYDLDWRIVEKFSTGGTSVSSSSTSSTNNAIARFDGTSGQTIKTSTATLSDTGDFATSGTYGTTASPFRLTSTSVTQANSLGDPVTCNSNSGKITSFGAYSTAAGGTASPFTVNNSTVTATSKVIANISSYSGTYTTNGIPIVHVSNITGGSFQLRVSNVHGTNALNGIIVFDFIVSS